MESKEVSKSTLKAEAIKIIALKYGYDAQSRQLIEEMAELTQAVNKFWRKQLGCGKNNLDGCPKESKEYDNLVEEIADVQIMLWQMLFMLGAEEQMQVDIESKLQRQINRILESEG